MKNQNIAIIGAGTAGLAAAALLQMRGHRVTLFEKFDAAKPLGAGLLLQPTGLAVLARLGLDAQIIEQGSIIHQLHGKACGARFPTLDVAYKDLSPHLFGIGAHRGDLFLALYSKALETGVHLRCGIKIDAVEDDRLIGSDGQHYAGFDAIIDASGHKSRLRRRYADVALDKPYPYGAVWAIVNLPPDFAPDTLDQRYQKAHHMIGVLPVGKGRAAFFWSMRVADYEAWRAEPLSDWQAYVASLWPQTRGLLDQFTHHDDLAFAHYSDIILRRYHHGRLVFIGDAAHCTSPQLGQGANLALVDALVLSECINNADSMEEAFVRFGKQRKKHLRFYQMASRALTPFFQSDNRLFPAMRFLIFGIGGRIPFTRKRAAQLLAGTQTGWFSVLDPGEWNEAYRIG